MAWNGRKALKVLAGGVVAVSLAAWGGWHATLKYYERDFLSGFKDPPAGPRAPRTQMRGLVVGRTTLQEGRDAAVKLGGTCVDTSTRSMMQGIREKKEQAFWERIKRGEFKRSEPSLPDGYGKKLIRYMANPQVRLACDLHENVLVDGGLNVQGRWLMIFDSEDLPLRHASFRLDLADPALAAARYRTTLDELTAVYGPPHRTLGHMDTTEDGRPTLPAAVANKALWDWADLHVELVGLYLGKGRSAAVDHRVEVPVGIRPDAPAVNGGGLVARSP